MAFFIFDAIGVSVGFSFISCFSLISVGKALLAVGCCSPLRKIVAIFIDFRIESISSTSFCSFAENRFS